MAFSIKKHEVDRLVNVTVALGWVLEQELPDDSGVTVVLRRDISEGLLALDRKGVVSFGIE